jgi:COMPASS component SWD1
VGSSDGIVDIWGPRINWIAFAPDFQALQQNVLYEEQEDEFDVVMDGEGDEGGIGSIEHNMDSCEDEEVDIVTLQNDDDLFYFETRVLKMMPDKPIKKVEQD